MTGAEGVLGGLVLGIDDGDGVVVGVIHEGCELAERIGVFCVAIEVIEVLVAKRPTARVVLELHAVAARQGVLLLVSRRVSPPSAGRVAWAPACSVSGTYTSKNSNNARMDHGHAPNSGSTTRGQCT